jgi:hypothetical protein
MKITPDGKLFSWYRYKLSGDPEADYLKFELRKNIEKVLLKLKNREAEILVRHAILEETLEELGGRFDLTRERIRQIYKRAIEKIKTPVLCKYLGPFLSISIMVFFFVLPVWAQDELKYNPYDHKWSYERSDSEIEYNAMEQRHEWVEPGEVLQFNSFENRYEYSDEDGGDNGE